MSAPRRRDEYAKVVADGVLFVDHPEANAGTTPVWIGENRAQRLLRGTFLSVYF